MFHVTIQCAKGLDMTDQPQAAKPKILVAEDSLDQGKLLQVILQRSGFEVIWMTNGFEAFEYLQKHHAEIQLLISDVVMSGMTGFELIKKAQQQGFLPPTLLLTAKGAESDVLQGLEGGALDYVTKPYSPSELIVRVKKLLVRVAGSTK